MIQSAEEYLPIIYGSELETFGFTGTSVPWHIKEFVLEFEDGMLPEDHKRRVENMAGTCMDLCLPLPEGVRLTKVNILCCEEGDRRCCHCSGDL